MDKDEAKKALAQLDYYIANSKNVIAGLMQNKQSIKSDINGISASKKGRMEYLQKNINGTRIAQQKKRKRDSKDREKKAFDSRIESKRNQIENIDTRIADERKKISDWETTKKAIKLDQINRKK
jgi:hypothetical protein